MPQDEFLRGGLLCEFINRFEITDVFSVAPESEWPKIYESVDRDRVRFSRVLTGYLGEETVERIDRIVAGAPERPTDVGYRAHPGAPWLGRHGMLKGRIGEEFERSAPAHGLSTDISMRDEDVHHGDDWFRFLAACKYTIGIEGGATVLDRDGVFKERTERYLAEHPDAGYDEVEANCFPGEDGKLALMAISPRHLEACATGTCQVLVEGSYNGILRPGDHYIELRDDLSNLEQVLETMASDRGAAPDHRCRPSRHRRLGPVRIRELRRRGRRRDPGGGRRGGTWDGAEGAAGGRRRPGLLGEGAPRPVAATPAQQSRRPRASRSGRRLPAAPDIRHRAERRRGRIGPEVKGVASVTPLAVVRDSRTYKHGASLARLGYESVVVEDKPSGPGVDAPPFELVSATAAGPAAGPAAPGSPRPRPPAGNCCPRAWWRCCLARSSGRCAAWPTACCARPRRRSRWSGCWR